MNVAITKHFNRQKRKFRNIAERDAIDVAIEKFQENPANPGLSMEEVHRTKAKDIWSARVNQDIRLILYRSKHTWFVLWVDRHNDAYTWAERLKRVGPNVHIGALQIIHVEEVYEQQVVEIPAGPQRVFEDTSDEELLALGLPEEALSAVRRITEPEEILEFDTLPEAVWERLINLAQGEPVRPPAPVDPNHSPLDHPDTRREFFFVEDDEDLERILHADWEEWLTFLHPTQHKVAYGSFSGPCRVTGSAGTGKTVVALHRAKHLASQGKKILITTFTTTLANNLQGNLGLLCNARQLNRITVDHVHGVARKILESARRNIKSVGDTQLQSILEKAKLGRSSAFSLDFLFDEWTKVIDTQGITTWEEYRSARRTGRGRPLRVRERKDAWRVFEKALETMHIKGMATYSGLCRLARLEIEGGTVNPSWDCVIVDEVQDLGIQELLLLKAISGTGPDDLMVTGDSGQRIYPGGFSLSALGIETRGRSFVLRVNYRSSMEIKEFADKILSTESDDLDGEKVRRDETISLFLGPKPEVLRVKTAKDQAVAVGQKIMETIENGRKPGAIAVFARTKKELEKLEEFFRGNGQKTLRLKDDLSLTDLEYVRLGTMHRAKGLEFRSVFIIGAHNKNLPHQGALRRLEGEDRDAAIERERNLLYVAATRARDNLYIYYYGQPSPFLKDAGLLEDA